MMQKKLKKKHKNSKFARVHHNHRRWFISWFCFYFNYTYNVNFCMVPWGMYKLFSMSMLFIPHSSHSFRNKITEIRRKWLKDFKFVLVKIYSLTYCLPLLPRFWNFNVFFADSSEFTLFSPTLSEIEHGWMSTFCSKSVALCTKNICSSKYFFFIS